MDHSLPPDRLQAMHDFMQHSVYLMGLSFILGSVFTILMLAILEFMRRYRIESSENFESHDADR